MEVDLSLNFFFPTWLAIFVNHLNEILPNTIEKSKVSLGLYTGVALPCPEADENTCLVDQ
jgi:hypothetical protein